MFYGCAGAAWIHGTNNNLIIVMCDSYGISYVEHLEMEDSSNTAIVDLFDDNERTVWTASALCPLVYEGIPTIKPKVSVIRTFLDGKADLMDA